MSSRFSMSCAIGDCSQSDAHPSFVEVPPLLGGYVNAGEMLRPSPPGTRQSPTENNSGHWQSLSRHVAVDSFYPARCGRSSTAKFRTSGTARGLRALSSFSNPASAGTATLRAVAPHSPPAQLGATRTHLEYCIQACCAACRWHVDADRGSRCHLHRLRSMHLASRCSWSAISANLVATVSAVLSAGSVRCRARTRLLSRVPPSRSTMSRFNLMSIVGVGSGLCDWSS